VSDIDLRHAETDAEVAACFPVMTLLRPHLTGADEFVARVARQHKAGYRILAVWREGAPIALAGYRADENLIDGRFVYVDDLVTAKGERNRGLGTLLLNAVAAKGRKLCCDKLVLDTALGNILAQRFYHRKDLRSRALRFSRPISPT
jgi:ribosomal protein S18 acetylase RimI-like enzyme